MATPVYVRAQSRVSIPTIVGLVDGIPDSTVKRSSKVVQHPVEDGSVISDHVHASPVQVNLTVYISDVVTTPGSQPAGESKQQIAHNTIRELYEANELLTLTTPFESLENMVINSVSWDRRSGASLGLELAMSLTQVRIVSDRASARTTTQATSVGGLGIVPESRITTANEDGSRLIQLDNQAIQVINLTFPTRTFDGFRTINSTLGRHLILSWNIILSAWILDIYEEDNTPLWLAHKLVVGEQNIPRYGQGNTAVLGGTLFVGGSSDEPGRTAWGNTHTLIWRQYG